MYRPSHQYRPRHNFQNELHNPPFHFSHEIPRQRALLPRPVLNQQRFNPPFRGNFNTRSQIQQHSRDLKQNINSPIFLNPNQQNARFSQDPLPGLDNFDSPRPGGRCALLPNPVDTFRAETGRGDFCDTQTENNKRDSIPFLSEEDNCANSSGAFYNYRQSDLLEEDFISSPSNIGRFGASKDHRNNRNQTSCDNQPVDVLNSSRRDRVQEDFSKSSNCVSALEEALDMLETKDAVVGLDYIVEYKDKLSVAGSMPFRCKLCNCAISRLSIVDHITGVKHRLRYLKVKDEAKHIQLNTQQRGMCRNEEIAEITFELEKTYGRGKVTVEIGNKSDLLDSRTSSNDETQFKSETVLSLDDIPITSDLYSPDRELSASPKHSTTSDKEKNSTVNNVPQSQDVDNQKQQEEDPLPSTNTEAVFSTDYFQLDMSRSNFLDSSVSSKIDFSALSSTLAFLPRLNDDAITQCNTFPTLPMTSQASLSDSRENVVYSNYTNNPVSCISNERNIDEKYQNVAQNVFSSDTNQFSTPFRSNEASSDVIGSQYAYKRSSSPSIDERLQKAMKTGIESQIQNMTGNFAYGRESADVPVLTLKDIPQSGSNITNSPNSSFDERSAPFHSDVLHENSLSNHSFYSNMQSDERYATENAPESQRKLETDLSLNVNSDVEERNNYPLKSISSVSVQTDEIVPTSTSDLLVKTEHNEDDSSRDELDSEESINIQSCILENLVKCEIATDEEANIALQAVAALMESFLRYKLQHVPGNEVELLIQSLHNGKMEGIASILGFANNKDEEMNPVTEVEIETEEKEKSTCQDPENNDHITTSGKDENSGSFNEKAEANISNINTVNNIESQPLPSSQQCEILSTTTASHVRENSLEKTSTEIQTSNVPKTVPINIPVSAPPQPMKSTPSLVPPPFFGQSTGSNWPSNLMLQNCTPFLSAPENNSSWSPQYQVPNFSQMPFHPAQHLSMMHHSLPFLNTQQYHQAAQAFGNQSMFQNNAMQSAMMSVPRPPLPPDAQPPLPPDIRPPHMPPPPPDHLPPPLPPFPPLPPSN